jgi:hypothetical protein
MEIHLFTVDDLVKCSHAHLRLMEQEWLRGLLRYTMALGAVQNRPVGMWERDIIRPIYSAPDTPVPTVASLLEKYQERSLDLDRAALIIALLKLQHLWLNAKQLYHSRAMPNRRRRCVEAPN